MQGIFQKENTDKALKYGIYRHLPTYEKIIRNLVSFYMRKLYIVKYIIKMFYPTGKILPPTNSLTKEFLGIPSLGIPST